MVDGLFYGCNRQQTRRKNISANLIAAFYHDYVFVQANRAKAALVALKEFALESPDPSSKQLAQ